MAKPKPKSTFLKDWQQIAATVAAAESARGGKQTANVSGSGIRSDVCGVFLTRTT
jgi:hypothetical protein